MVDGTYGTPWVWPVTPGLLYLAHSYHRCSTPLLNTVTLLAHRPGLHAGKGLPGGYARLRVERGLTAPRASVLGSDPSILLLNTTQTAIPSEESPSSCLGAQNPGSLCTASPHPHDHTYIWGLSHCSSCLYAHEPALSRGGDDRRSPLLPWQPWLTLLFYRQPQYWKNGGSSCSM